MDNEKAQRGSGIMRLARPVASRSALWPWIAIGCLALGIRLLYFWQVHATDLATVLMGDARGYDAWATRIAAGGWLGDRVFYQAPLYPYFMAAVFSIGGHQFVLLRILQCLIGAVSCVFLGRAGAHFFSRPIGYVAGTLLALNPTAIFFDCLIQKAVLDLFLFTLVLMLAGSAGRHRGKVWNWLALGAALGGLTLTRENALVLLPLLIVWGLRRGTRRDAGMVALGAGLVLLPVALRNLAVGGEFHLTTAQMGPNFYIGNNENADGTYQPLRPRRGDVMFEQIDATEMAEQNLGRKLTPREVSDFWMSKSLEFIRRDPWRWASLIWRKWFLVWNAAELGDTEEQGAYEEYSSLLRGLARCLHFGVLFPLAAMGLVWTWRERRQLWILYAITLAYALSVAAFYVFSRYRFPLIPLGILFAAAGIFHGVVSLRRASPRLICAVVVTGLGATVFANWPATGRNLEGAVTFCNLGLRLSKLGEYDRAVGYLRRALEKVPNYDEAHYGLSTALTYQGHYDEALKHLQTAVTLAPGNSDAQYNLGVLLQEHLGRSDDAIPFYRNTIRLDPSRTVAYNNLANILSAKGDVSEALELLQIALKLDPSYTATYVNMSSALSKAGRNDEAIKVLEQAVEIEPDLWQAHFNLGRFKALRGDAAGSVSSFRRAEQFIPADSRHLEILRAMLAEQESILSRQR